MSWEENTMPCANWCCDHRPHAWFSPTLYRKNLARFWPIWALYGALWFLILPVGILNGGASFWMPSFYYCDPQAPQTFFIAAIRAGIEINPVFGIAAAMAVFSYLSSPRACGMMHALPIRREGLFLTNYLSGLSFFFFPLLAVALLALSAQVYVWGNAALTALFLWGWSQAMMLLFFFSLGVFCAMLTGHLLALPGFYALFNLLAPGLYGLYQQTASLLLFGYVPDPTVESWVHWLTPVLCYNHSLGSSGPPDYRPTGLLCIFVYAFLGLIFSVLALLLYRRRALESAGDVVVAPWLRPLFRWCLSLFASVYLGSFLWGILFPDRVLVVPLLICFLLMGALGYFVAEMLLRKTFRVFRRSWPGCLVCLGVVTLGFSALALDAGGYETRVPPPETVVSITLSTSSIAPYDDAGIYSDYAIADADAATALHRSIVDRRRTLEYSTFSSQWTETSYGGQTLSVEEESYCRLDFSYYLTSGRVLRRSYQIPVDSTLLEDPASPAGRLESLLNDPALLDRAYFRNVAPGDSLSAVYLSAPRLEDGHSFGPTEAQSLYEAVRADLAAGRLGRRYLLEDAERMEVCYYNDLTFTFLPAREQGPAAAEPYTVTITLQSTATDTLAALEALDAAGALVSKGKSGL